MAFFLLEVMSVLLFGSLFADGPMPPTLDFMLKFFGLEIYTGIEHARPLLLTYVPPKEADPPILLQIPDWLVGVRYLVLGGLLLSLIYLAVIYFYYSYNTGGGESVPSVIEGETQHKARVVTLMKRKWSAQNFSPQEVRGFGRISEIRLKGREGKFLQDSFYALRVDAAVMSEIRRGSGRTTAYIRRVFTVNMEFLEDDDHFLLFSGPRDGVEAAYKYLRRNFG